MTDEKNPLFMNDPRRVSAQRELDAIVRHIQTDISTGGSAQYYLTVLPLLLERLTKAYDNLTAVEATLLAELEKQSREQNDSK